MKKKCNHIFSQTLYFSFTHLIGTIKNINNENLCSIITAVTFSAVVGMA
jgi:hypothetical protein